MQLLAVGDALAHPQVSILTRPEGRVQPPVGAVGVAVREVVSILTRPEGRVQPAQALSHLLQSLFQSSPGQKAGCNRTPIVARIPADQVSILTRPEGRVQRCRGGSDRRALVLFQSSPGQKAGCNACI